MKPTLTEKQRIRRVWQHMRRNGWENVAPMTWRKDARTVRLDEAVKTATGLRPFWAVYEAQEMSDEIHM